MTDSLKNSLLGLSSYNPPESLRSGARYTHDEYTALLDSAMENPEKFWLGMAEEIQWQSQPATYRDTGELFGKGTLNLRFCVEKGEVAGFDRETLQKQIRFIISQISSWNLPQRQRVLIAVSNNHHLLVACLACLELGLTCVPVNSDCDDVLLVKRIKDAACAAAIFSGPCENAEMLPEKQLILECEIILNQNMEQTQEQAPVVLNAMHPAFVVADSAWQLFTLPLGGFMVQAISAWRHLLDGRKTPDTLWIMTPPHHVSSLAASFGALASGGGVGYLPYSPDLKEFARHLGQVEPRVLLVNVKSLVKLVEEKKSTDEQFSLKAPELLIVEGETVEPGVWHYLHEKMFDKKVHTVQMLARPESGGFVAGPHPGSSVIRPSSVDLPAPGIDLMIVDNHGNECQANIGGLLALRHRVPALALELTELPLPISLEVKARKSKGSLWTMSELTVSRSQKSKIAIPEIEAVIAKMQGVEQVAVVGFEEGVHNKTKAFVKLLNNHSTVSVDQIRQTIIDSHGPGAVPDEIDIVESLPHTRTGKLLRSVLRRRSSGQPIRSEDTSLLTTEEKKRRDN